MALQRQVGCNPHSVAYGSINHRDLVLQRDEIEAAEFEYKTELVCSSFLLFTFAVITLTVPHALFLWKQDGLLDDYEGRLRKARSTKTEDDNEISRLRAQLTASEDGRKAAEQSRNL